MKNIVWGQRLMRSGAGYSVIELMLTVGIMGVLGSMAAAQVGAARPGMKGDGAMRVITAQMNTARELAITQRRNMQVTFTNGNQVQIVREEVPGPETTVVSTIQIEGGVQFGLVAGVPDTPDAFGNHSGVDFGTATSVKFSSDGTFVNQSGSMVNGTVYVQLQNQSLSARAVTVFGSTGRVRAYRWDGRAWKLV